MTGLTPYVKFKKHHSTTKFSISPQTYLSSHAADSIFQYLATGAVVFDNPIHKDPRILLIQRAAHDSSPNRWEIPGGAVDDDDETVLHAVARELYEESGLVATQIGPVVGDDPHYFTSRSGKAIGKFVFFVEVEGNTEGEGGLVVKLDPNEHQEFIWVTEDEVKDGKAGGMELEFVTAELRATVLTAFRLRREAGSTEGYR